MRWFMVVALVGCSEPQWGPPPANAVARCEYDSNFDFPRSAIYFDANDRVMRADGYGLDDDHQRYPATWTFEYDALGRIAADDGPYGHKTYAWSDERIDISGAYGATYIVENGRAVSHEFPLDVPAAERNRQAVEYDSNGRISRDTGAVRYSDGGPTMIARHDKFYEYDEQGRVITIHGGARAQRRTELRYTSSPQQLVVTEVRFESGQEQMGVGSTWTLDFDSDGRMTRFASPSTETRFTYGDGWFTEEIGIYSTTATGRCAQPEMTFAPTFSLPGWYAALQRPMLAPHFLPGIAAAPY